jgi:hypothetical protein
VVELLTPAEVDLIVRRRRGDLAINLVHSAGIDSNLYTLDQLRPTPPLQLRIRIDRPVVAAELQPQDAALTLHADGDGVVVDVPPFEIHGVVIVKCSEM